MSDNRFRINTGIPKEIRKAYIAQSERWCEHSLRFGDGEFDIDCLDYRHYVRCVEHEYCHCTGDTLILICECCWPLVLNEMRGRMYAARADILVPERKVSDLHRAIARMPERKRRYE